MMPEWGLSQSYNDEAWGRGELAYRYTPYLMNPITQTLKPIRPPPTGFEQPLVNPTLSSLQGTMYLVGGDGTRGVQDAVYAYHPRIDAWFSGPRLPMPLYMHTAVSMYGANLLLTLGGNTTGHDATNAVCSYDPREPVWTLNSSSCTLPLSAFGISAAAVDDHTVLALAGRSPTTNEAEVPSLFAPHLLDIRMWQWRPCPAPLPEGYNLSRESATAVTFQGKVVVVGGLLIDNEVEQDYSVLSSDVLAYSAEGQGRWEMLQPLPVGLERPSLAVVRVPEGAICVVP